MAGPTPTATSITANTFTAGIIASPHPPVIPRGLSSAPGLLTGAIGGKFLHPMPKPGTRCEAGGSEEV